MPGTACPVAHPPHTTYAIVTIMFAADSLDTTYRPKRTQTHTARDQGKPNQNIGSILSPDMHSVGDTSQLYDPSPSAHV